MKHLILAIAGLTLIVACSSSASANPTSSIEMNTQRASISPADFKKAEGDGWSGTLSYLDYSKEMREAIPVKVTINAPKRRSVSYAIQYPGESQYNSHETLRLSKDGTRLNGETVVGREMLADGSLQIVTETAGQDDNRPAMIRTTYIVSDAMFKVRKDVKFDGEANYFNRNEFSLTR